MTYPVSGNFSQLPPDFRQFDVNKDNIISKREISSSKNILDDFTGVFFKAGDEAKNGVLDNMDDQSRMELFANLRQSYKKETDEKLKNEYVDAIFNLAVYQIKQMPLTQNTKAESIVLNILKFMNLAATISDDAVRDKCALTGKQILAEGNTVSCGEAARWFAEILKGVYPDVKYSFVHSFEEAWALNLLPVEGEPKRPDFRELKTEEEKIQKTQDWIKDTEKWLEDKKTGPTETLRKGLNDICGHTVIEIFDEKDGSVFIVNTSNFFEIGKPKVSEEEAARVVKKADKIKRGACRQIKNKNLDLRIIKEKDNFRVTHYEYGFIDKENHRNKDYQDYTPATIEEVNCYIQTLAFSDITFNDLIPSLIKKEEPPEIHKENQPEHKTPKNPQYRVFRYGGKNGEYVIYKKAEIYSYVSKDKTQKARDEGKIVEDLGEAHIRKALEWLQDPDAYKPDIAADVPTIFNGLNLKPKEKQISADILNKTIFTKDDFETLK